jgi:hypothetical protein
VTGSHKVVGSIPISSTNEEKGLGFLPNPFVFTGPSKRVSSTLIFVSPFFGLTSYNFSSLLAAEKKSCLGQYRSRGTFLKPYPRKLSLTFPQNGSNR